MRHRHLDEDGIGDDHGLLLRDYDRHGLELRHDFRHDVGLGVLHDLRVRVLSNLSNSRPGDRH